MLQLLGLAKRGGKTRQATYFVKCSACGDTYRLTTTKANIRRALHCGGCERRV